MGELRPRPKTPTRKGERPPMSEEEQPDEAAAVEMRPAEAAAVEMRPAEAAVEMRPAEAAVEKQVPQLPTPKDRFPTEKVP